MSGSFNAAATAAVRSYQSKRSRIDHRLARFVREVVMFGTGTHMMFNENSEEGPSRQ